MKKSVVVAVWTEASNEDSATGYHPLSNGIERNELKSVLFLSRSLSYDEMKTVLHCHPFQFEYNVPSLSISLSK